VPKKPWFPHDGNASADEKLEGLALEHGFSGIGRWWNLVEHLLNQDGYRLKVTELTPSTLAKRWTSPVEPFSAQQASELLNAFVERFHLLERADGMIWSPSLIRRMREYDEACERKRIAGIASAKARKAKYGTASPNGVRIPLEHRSNTVGTVLRTDRTIPSFREEESLDNSLLPPVFEASNVDGAGGATSGASAPSNPLEILEAQAAAGNSFAARKAKELRRQHPPDDTEDGIPW
jgi:hypothetical protein